MKMRVDTRSLLRPAPNVPLMAYKQIELSISAAANIQRIAWLLREPPVRPRSGERSNKVKNSQLGSFKVIFIPGDGSYQLKVVKEPSCESMRESNAMKSRYHER